jgi:phosphinothricin acetyltransferase
VRSGSARRGSGDARTRYRAGVNEPDAAPVLIGAGTRDDLPGIVAILNETIANSHATFETRPLRVADLGDWFARFGSTGPYRLLVARRGRRVLGYAFSRPYRDQAAFARTVETGIALDATCRGKGLGTRLYRALFDALFDAPVHAVVAGIALPNDASVALHLRCGFTEVGVFREYAVKNGRYISSLWMQRLQPDVDRGR